MKVYYLVYKLTNTVNGKIYIGCHITKNVDDGYMGSGKRLAYAKKKYGVENFKKEILSFHESPEEMLAEEVRLVNEEFLGRANVYNLTCGGRGSWFYVNQTLTPEQRTKAGLAGGFANQRNLSLSSLAKIAEGRKNSGKLAAKRLNEEISNGLKDQYFKGRSHSQETRAKMSKKQSSSMVGNKRQLGCKMMFDPNTGRQFRIKSSEIESKMIQGLVIGMSPLIKAKVSSTLKEASKLKENYGKPREEEDQATRTPCSA
jgi:hypothetical protein